ncbi:MAG TPA: hypothetical protein VFT79_11140 [Solirubrobacterales bacterium]|nr:hypothetical protein [Solirubrobacterales bacterium]
MEAAVAALHQQLEHAGVPHAFGGAFALAYYGTPRPTSDIDVNVFVQAQESEVRFEWEGTLVHFFFSCDPLHEEMERRVREVPFGDGTIPIVTPEHLIIRKALLDRTKDWVDIEQIFVATSPLDVQEMEGWMKQLAGVDDPRLAKLRSASGEFGPL